MCDFKKIVYEYFIYNKMLVNLSILFLNLSTPKIENCPKSMLKIFNEKYLDFFQKNYSLIYVVHSFRTI